MKKLLLLIGFASLTMNAQVPSYVPTSGLVCFYPFTGNANDVSGNSYDGTTSNVALTTDRFGNINSAYNFVGSSGSVITASPILPIGNASRTISAWVKSTSATGGSFGQNINVMVNWGINQSGKMCELDFDLGKATFNTYGAVTLYSNTSINDNVWHNVIGTYDNITSTIKIYIDGVLKGTLSGTFNTTNSQLYIGERGSEITFQKMDGTLDDIGVWNRALTPSEITSLYYADSCQSLTINTGVLSYNPPTYNNTITIYPNPAQDQITIDCGTLANVVGYHIEIVNTLGQIVFNQPMNTQQYNVPLNTWSGTGVYFVKVYDASNNLVNTKKIILQ